ncbi:uncharacterized protein MONOS_10938 [Monocercomonoides exilis]|uniref:uncharacterized protein n=1 Tax=Monocercomonoides exilis TaxID=2049356 RepID=UPI00355A089D|nr:hypothetical protein MONOS_10938 [Monocercomonoides exilis]|eukprot:MONOS_10938.1-p1 / transcript=MONOS_10938.1 / gene=MONOS_10938 / organism=Monocercomonoides_exilis_PA203 / gene_product=unspecified product / transcript_product=unspecified product / location=Mono_scaffold00520:17375-18042(+) / protein_length=125 / sequence_SO=supercontig / SO=protein_coding / is_pseudo=false
MARIVVDGHVRIVDAINTKEFSRSAIIRAVSAIESGRAVAKPGRPELFNEEDKNIIVGVIKIESLSGTSLNAKRTRELMESVLSDKKRRSETDVDENARVPAGFHTTPANMPNATLVVTAASDG